MGGGPVKGAKEVTGGYLNYAFIVGNLVLAWFGWFLAMCSISALQHQYSNNPEGVNPELNGWAAEGVFAGFAINSGYPALPPNRLLRFEWFIFWLTFVVLGVVCLALIGRVNRQTRSMLTGYMSVTLALLLIVTNRVYDLSHFSGHNKYYHSARALFTGFIFLDIAFFGLIYLLGLEF